MSRKTTPNNLETLRHSASHVLAAAVLEMFPEAKLAIGPAIENGFYYDFDLPRTLIPEDLEILEEKMKAIIKADHPFERAEISIAEAIKKFEEADQVYKVELISDLEKAGEKKVSVYKSGHLVDLCAGPHVESTGKINPESFKLTKISGAYWRGDEKNKMLQRIYGVAFENKKELDAYLKMLEEAEKRDHRKLGKELDLFHIDEVVGLGLPLWHPKGAILWRVIEDFWYAEHLKNGYELVRSPHIGNRTLWETSGHWGFYNESMYPPMEVGQTLRDSQEGKKAKAPEQFLLKPMNCPFHIQIFNSNLHSYRELPFRWAECGTVYRYEKKGELSGLTRVRGFTQDDAHIICRVDQVKQELEKVVDFILFIYKSFGFAIDDVNVYLSVRDPKNEKYAGTEDGWKFTEKVLEEVAKEKKLNITKDVGGAVFYGPKLDFKVKDAIGREWQCSTLQFDFNMPEQFAMSFINEKGEKEKPYMLHRALFGSFERFIGVLIEHYAGAFPLWLSPVQVMIIPVSEKFNKYGEKILAELKENNIRAEINKDDESLGKRIREAEKQKIPYMIVVGEKEEKDGTVAVRTRGQKEQEVLKVDEFVEKIRKEIDEKK
ncbi:MAG: threonine--tRNA ligase [Parcubacteria group bacterium]|jgi:threonyl-tRNA synthetase